MNSVEAEIIQIADLSWDIRMHWYGKTVILNAFASAKEAVAELISLYPTQHLWIRIVPVASHTTAIKEKASA